MLNEMHLLKFHVERTSISVILTLKYDDASHTTYYVFLLCSCCTGTTTGETATYTCNTGYQLSGSAIVTCEANATWAAKPNCDGKHAMKRRIT